MMRSHSAHLPFAILLSTLLAGCAGLHAPKNPENRNIAAEEKIAADTVNQLTRIYPPAKTQFNLVITEPRSFGRVLASRLRVKGYAVAETTEKNPRSPFDALGVVDAFGASFPPNPGNRADQETERKTKASSASGTGPGTELRYTLDDSHADSLLRISLKVGGAYLARAYLADNGDVAAAGAWTYKGE
jgi:hypothetical protein